MPPEALGIAKLFSANVAFVILCPRVDRLMLAEVKSLSEILPTHGAVVGLFSSVDAIVPAEGLAACETLPAHAAKVSAWKPAWTHSGSVLPTFGGLSSLRRVFLSSGFTWTFWFGSGVLGVAAHWFLVPHTSEILINARC